MAPKSHKEVEVTEDGNTPLKYKYLKIVLILVPNGPIALPLVLHSWYEVWMNIWTYNMKETNILLYTDVKFCYRESFLISSIMKPAFQNKIHYRAFEKMCILK